jgi:hypothetical protein
MSLMPAESLTEKGGEVKDYFEKLGYQVTWDFKINGGTWWEIVKGNKLVAQIDMGVSLPHILEDLCQFHLGNDKGIDRSDKPNYTVNGFGPVFDEMLEKVYNEQHVK